MYITKKQQINLSDIYIYIYIWLNTKQLASLTLQANKNFCATLPENKLFFLNIALWIWKIKTASPLAHLKMIALLPIPILWLRHKLELDMRFTYMCIEYSVLSNTDKEIYVNFFNLLYLSLC